MKNPLEFELIEGNPRDMLDRETCCLVNSGRPSLKFYLILLGYHLEIGVLSLYIVRDSSWSGWCVFARAILRYFAVAR